MSRTTLESLDPNPELAPSFESGRRLRFGFSVTVGALSTVVLTLRKQNLWVEFGLGGFPSE